MPSAIRAFLPLFLLAAWSFPEKAMPFEPVKIALAQVRCTDSDLEGNFARIATLVAQADSAGARIVLFPETADLGWVNPEAHALAGSIPGPFADRVCALAREHSLWIGIGLCEKEDGRLYDSAVLIDNTGALRLKHRKINLLSWLMDPPYTPGDSTEVSVCETPFGRVGILICADSFRDNLLKNLAAAKPDLVYIPYGWAAKKEEWPEHSFSLVLTVQRASHTLGAPVFGPNVVGTITHGPWTGWTYEGLSTAAGANGLSLCQGPWNREGLIMVEVTPGRLTAQN